LLTTDMVDIDAANDSHPSFDNGSTCQCRACGWHGTVGEAKYENGGNDSCSSVPNGPRRTS
jgi:hypothetical protein